MRYRIRLHAAARPGWNQIRDRYPGDREDVERLMRLNLEVWAKARCKEGVAATRYVDDPFDGYEMFVQVRVEGDITTFLILDFRPS
jgi:hypothetical protein